jgi:uncharacterized membrane protein YkoI
MTPCIFAAALAAAVLATVAVAAPSQIKGHALSGQAKVSLEQARAIATNVRPGKIIDQELEKEAGGSGLRYAFDIKAAKATYEVGVDAVTGKVLENGSETAGQEAAEAKADKKAH